jgi:cell wall-associated NlpC family hydrolase
VVSRVSPRHRRRLGVFVGIALLLPAAASVPASGDPLDEKRAEAARIQDQLDAQGRKVSVAAEQFNRAQLHLTEVQGSLTKAEADLKKSTDRMGEIRGRLADVALAAYVHGGTNATLSRLVRSASQTNMVVRRQYMQVTAADQRAILGELRSAKEDLTLVQGRLRGEEKNAKAAAEEAADLRRQAVAAEDAQRGILTRVQGELSQLVSAEAARRAAEEAARRPAAVFDDAPVAQAAPAAVSTTAPARAPAPAASVAPAASTAPVPASSRAAIAVQTAEAQIGKPYVYGGSGPDSFDCSGLTAFAWRAAGVYLSHSAYTQWFETTRVPIDQVQPGDLLFFGRDGVESIHHNAIYVGGGQMIEASQTGVPIRYRGWRAGDLVGAGRPG